MKITGHELVKQIGKLIDIRGLKSFELKVEVGEAVTLKTEQYVDGEFCEGVERYVEAISQEYELTPKNEVK